MDFKAAITILHDGHVECIVIGGVAATLHGSARVTADLDVLYARSEQNVARLVRALAPVEPYLRGAPAGLPFCWDVATVKAGLNFALATTIGAVDLLGEMAGIGRYEAAVPHASPMSVFGRSVLVLDLDCLIRAKRAAGRPKDLEVLAELELLQDPAVRAAAAAVASKKVAKRRRR